MRTQTSKTKPFALEQGAAKVYEFHYVIASVCVVVCVTSVCVVLSASLCSWCKLALLNCNARRHVSLPVQLRSAVIAGPILLQVEE